MRVVLTVVSEDGPDLGSRAGCEFDEKGGTIGRNSHCHWSLPDPTNTISARHAVISHNGRGFLITDMSTNGVFLNTVEAPIGRGSEAMLRDGDTLYLGHYVVAVEVIQDPAAKSGGPAASMSSRDGTETGMAPPNGMSDLDFRLPVPEKARPNAPSAVAPPLAAPGSGRTPLPSMDTLFGANDASRLGPSRFPEAVMPPHAEPAARPSAIPPPTSRPLIPDDFLADLLGSAPLASVPPIPGGLSRAAAIPVEAGSFTPLPKVEAVLPVAPQSQPAGRPTPSTGPSADVGPTAEVPPLPPGDVQKAGARSGRSIYDDVVTLRPPGPDTGENRPGLDPVAILRRRGSGAPARSAETPPDAMPHRGAPADATSEAASDPRGSDRAAGAMPLPGRRSAGLGATATAAARPGEPVPARSGAGASPFWAALGIDPPGEGAQEAALLAQLGEALRAALNGIVPVLAARRSLKDAMRMDQTQLQGQDNNPLKFLPSGDAVLQALAAAKLGGFMPLPEAVAQGFADIQAHEVAAVVSLGAVARNVIDRLDPAALDGQGGSGRMFGRGADKAKLWDQYVAAHAALADRSDETTRKVVNEEFSRAYAEQVRAAKQGNR